ncbi:MAG: hypothetical protein OEZ39_10550 [Gammaproteobacteria bacterium]|nr:hypothetical protein [Gammaproteobacteria bacterium]MDH5652282.1 hypothetical protein [Gammaproteobacteria bacterium]
MTLKFVNMAIHFRVRLTEASMQQHLSASPFVVGEELARQIGSYARDNKLNYYPAIDFFQQNGGVEQDLLDAVGNISWLVTNMVREEVRVKLRPVFSSIKFESLQTQAYTMPTVRPSQNNALQLLKEHFTPDQVRVNIIVSILRKDHHVHELEQLARQMICRWLKNRFADLEITRVRLI